MLVDSMDCFLTYNLSCINGTLAQLNSSSLIFGDIFQPALVLGDERSTSELAAPPTSPEPASVFVSLQHCIITSIILGTIIVATITGNIFVIAAVKLEKSLHAVAYYLFVSLAVADLLIATMVRVIDTSLICCFFFQLSDARRITFVRSRQSSAFIRERPAAGQCD